jgi:hypothetical protein
MRYDRWFGAALLTGLGWSTGCDPDLMQFHSDAGAAGAEAEAGAGGTGGTTEPPDAGSPSTGGVSCPSCPCSGGTPGTGGSATGGGASPIGGEAGNAGFAGEAIAGGASEGGSAGSPPGWMGNAEDCPAEAPVHNTACDVSEGQVCAYSDPGVLYRECACHAYCSEEGPLVQWNCYQGIQANPADCPEQQPSTGDDCFGLKGLACLYPVAKQCKCPSDPGEDSWLCQEITGGEPVFPSGVDPATIVREMTAADRDAWCSWFADTQLAPGFPAPPVLEPDPDGYYPDTGCYQGTATCRVDMPAKLPKEPCIANLELSSCAAPVEELSHCVLSMITGGHPYARGCARYLEAAGCEGTMVGAYDPTSFFPECRIRVVE